MPALFAYLIVDRSGRKLRGEIEALDQDHAADQLRQRGDTVLEIRATAERESRLRLESQVALSDRQLADFAFELCALIASGAPLPRALATLASGAGSSRMSSLARDLKLQLELGNAASAALARAKSSGLRLFGRFLGAAEQGGRYDVMLGIAADFLGQRAAAFERIRSALAYPMFLLTASVVAIGFLVIYVSPSLAPMFEGAEMPPFIAVTSVVGAWVQTNYRAALALLAAMLTALFFGLRTEGMRGVLQGSLRAVPIIGRIANDLDFGPAVLAYAALLKSGWPAERGLRLTSEISKGRANPTFRAISSSLRDGATLTAAFRNTAGVPLEVIRAIEIGEETGTVPAALHRAGEHLVARSLKSIDRISAILGPVMIAAIGGLVAMVMISMLSSISSLGDVAA
jgi:type II secretory pathway component PulF